MSCLVVTEFDFQPPTRDAPWATIFVMDVPTSPSSALPVRPTVLVVDDDHLLRAGLRCMLNKHPYQVREAASGAAALDFLAKHPCDLMVCDEGMPGMRGTELAARVAEKFPLLPRVVLTGQATLETAMLAINLGHVFRFLTKPCPPDLFQAAVYAGLAERQRLLAADSCARHEAPVEAIEPSNPLFRLSEREEEIRKLVATGWRLNQVAEKLFLSRHTVRNHLKSVFRKLNIHSQADLTTKSPRSRPTA